MSKLQLMYALSIRMLPQGAIDFLGWRFWLMREFGLSENTAKYTVRMFFKWMIKGVLPHE